MRDKYVCTVKALSIFSHIDEVHLCVDWFFVFALITIGMCLINITTHIMQSCAHAYMHDIIQPTCVAHLNARVTPGPCDSRYTPACSNLMGLH